MLATLLALLWPAALAQEAARLDPPLPAAASPWSLAIKGYALPPQDLRWITDEAPARACEVRVAVSKLGVPEPSAIPSPGCPEGMSAAAVEATRSWRFEVDEAAEGPTALEIRYVLNYNATLGTTTLHAEVDPGAEHADERGAPGLMLVHRAGPREPVVGKLPKKAKKAGVGPGACVVLARVDAGGALLGSTPVDCPEALQADAARLLGKARLDPKTVDGMPYADEVRLTVRYER